MKKIFINAAQVEENRLAVVENDYLLDLFVESKYRPQYKSNIYVGFVSRYEPSLEAVFVDYGTSKRGFLPLKEIDEQYIQVSTNEKGDEIKNVESGKKIIVQIEKEERGNKGAALSSYISVPGRYLVFLPYNKKIVGISKKIDGDDRKLMTDLLNQLEVPEGAGIIIRTAGLNRDLKELQNDLNNVVEYWERIKNEAQFSNVPKLISAENKLYTNLIRDYLRHDVEEVLIDDKNFYDRSIAIATISAPDSVKKIKLYNGELPIFNAFGLEKQIFTAYEREVKLKSGGSIAIDQTEALYAIDVNSAKYIHAGDIENTALNTNLEACREIAKQLRLRDIGGLIVIDFIDMLDVDNQKEVEIALKRELKNDSARVNISNLSKFGLLEMTRQRLGTSLQDVISNVCPRCSGNGRIKRHDALIAEIIRRIEAESLRKGVDKIKIKLPIDISNYIINSKKNRLTEIEETRKVKILIYSIEELVSPHYKFFTQTLNDKRWLTIYDSAIESINNHKTNLSNVIYSEDFIFKNTKKKSLIRRFLGLFIKKSKNNNSQKYKKNRNNKIKRKNSKNRNNNKVNNNSRVRHNNERNSSKN